MAGALELVLRLQPVRRAAEVGADGDQRVDPPSSLTIQTPLASLKRSSTTPGGKSSGEPDLEAGRRLEEHVREHEPTERRHTATDGGTESHPGHRRPGEEAAARDLRLGCRRLGCRFRRRSSRRLGALSALARVSAPQRSPNSLCFRQHPRRRRCGDGALACSFVSSAMRPCSSRPRHYFSATASERMPHSPSPPMQCQAWPEPLPRDASTTPCGRRSPPAGPSDSGRSLRESQGRQGVPATQDRQAPRPR